MRRSRSSFQDLEGPEVHHELEEHSPVEEEEQEPQAKSKSNAKPRSKSAPKAEAAKPKTKSAPKAKAKGTAKCKASPKAKAKATAKCKASSKKASSSKSQEDTGADPAEIVEKPKSKGGRPKGSKNKPKEATDGGKKSRAARVAPSIRLNRKSADETPHDPEDYNYMLHFVHEFEDPEAELSVLKQEVKTWKPDWVYLVPDIYWSRWESALTFHYEDDEETPCKSNVGHFHFANNKPGLLVAIACSYLLAACR